MLGVLLLTSCLEDENEQAFQKINPEIEAAKSWYESFENEYQPAENARQSSKAKGKPDWSQSKVYRQVDGKKVVEVRMDWESLDIPEHLNTLGFKKSSVLNTLLLFPKANGKYAPYYLIIFPEKAEDYFEEEDFYQGGYQKIPGTFSGIYHFYDAKGKFIGGWRIEDGKKTHRIKSHRRSEGKPKKANQENARTVCYQVYTTWYQKSCSADGYCETRELDTTYDGVQCEYQFEIAPPTESGNEGGIGSYTPPGETDCEQPEGNILDVPVDCEEEEKEAEIGIDCNSFKFINTASNWQESAVANIRFKVKLSDGTLRSMVISRALYFGVPRKNMDGDLISGIDASNFAAGAVQRASDISHQLYVYDPSVQDITVQDAFLKLLKSQMTIVGGRVDFYGSGANLMVTNANYVLIGNGICW